MRYDVGRFRRPMRRSTEGQLVSLISLGDGSTLTLDFTTGVLDPRLTFTRASGGTYTGNDGLVYGMDFATSSSLAIGTGSKSVTLTATAGVDRRYLVGQTVYISNGANNMSGPVTAYNASTQVLTINATATTGSGSFTSWTVGNASARFDYDPTTGSPRGLSIEGSATNLCLNGSMAYTATAPTSWVRGFSGCTVASVDSTTFPGQKAWSISATAINQRDLLEQVISLAANTTYTVSVYLEAVTGTTATFAYMTSLPAGATSGTVVNPSAGRISFTVTVGATAGNGTLRLGIGTASGTGVSADASVRFSHVQVEAGSGASSYILTGASQGTRNPDYCVMDGISSFFTSQSSLTMLIDATPRFQSGFPALWRLTDAGNANSYELYYTSSGTNNTYATKVAVGGVSSGESNFANSIAQDTRQIMGYAIASGVGFRSRNGASASAQIPTSLPSAALTRLGIGSSGLSANPATAHIRRIKYWPYAMTQDQLNGVTTP